MMNIGATELKILKKKRENLIFIYCMKVKIFCKNNAKLKKNFRELKNNVFFKKLKKPACVPGHISEHSCARECKSIHETVCEIFFETSLNFIKICPRLIFL